jgi:hypothetical protein
LEGYKEAHWGRRQGEEVMDATVKLARHERKKGMHCENRLEVYKKYDEYHRQADRVEMYDFDKMIIKAEEKLDFDRYHENLIGVDEVNSR